MAVYNRSGSTSPPRHMHTREEKGNLWKAMHKPNSVFHPEADAFFAMGKYKFAISSRRGTPESLIHDIKVGDRIIVEPQTMLRKNGQPRKNPEKSGKVRKSLEKSGKVGKIPENSRTPRPAWPG